MKIGVVKEIKPDENRVALIPSGVEALAARGHDIFVERNAGRGSGFADREYQSHGATLLQTSQEVFAAADLVVKVKEPIETEYALLSEDKMLFAYFHFAASRPLIESVLSSKVTAIAYETVEDEDGHLPLLTPMSEVAGRMAIQQGAKYLEREHGGRGVLLGGVPGVPPAVVVILGAGVVGFNAATMAAGMGARVIILDIDLRKLRHINEVLPKNVVTLMSNPANIRAALAEADVVVSSVLIPGEKSPMLIQRGHLSTMKNGSVIIDVAIDQGGSVETSRPTEHGDPIFQADGVVHYCVTNMPGAMPLTSTLALTNATLPFIQLIADHGLAEASRQNAALGRGISAVRGELADQRIAQLFDLSFTPVDRILQRER